jgi:hypothetical protein
MFRLLYDTDFTSFRRCDFKTPDPTAIILGGLTFSRGVHVSIKCSAKLSLTSPS